MAMIQLWTEAYALLIVGLFVFLSLFPTVALFDNYTSYFYKPINYNINTLGPEMQGRSYYTL